MPDINLLKNTEKYDPITPKPVPPAGPGPLSDPALEAKGFGGAFRSLFSRRQKMIEPSMPVLGKALSGAGKMSLGKSVTGDRILNEKKSKPTMLQLPEEEGGFNVNLLGQEVGQIITLRRQLMKLAAVAGGCLALIGLLYAGLVFYSGTITTDINDTRAKIDGLRGEIAELESRQDEITAATKKITAVRSLIDRHVHWSKFFTELEKSTSPEVYYGTAFVGDLNGAVTLAARAPSFDAVATQYLFFRQALQRGGFIQNFSISAATLQQAKTGPHVSFTVALQVVPNVFYKTATEAANAETEPANPTSEPTTTLPTTP